MLTYVKLLTIVLVGLPVVLVGSPTLGEMIATMAPFYSPKRDKRLVEALGIPVKQVSFPTWDGKLLTGWYFPAEKENRPAIVYAPATGKDQRSGISLVKPLHEAGFNVLLFSYRGHGNSEGNRFGFTYGARESRDIDAAAAFLAEKMGIEKIGVIGHSAGAASAILSAAHNQRIGALVAAAPFPSVEEIWYTNRPRLLPKGVFELSFRLAERRKKFTRSEVRPQDVIDLIGPRPVLLIHGMNDRRITRGQAMELFETAHEPKCMWLVEGASHAQVRFPVLDGHIEPIIAFFQQALEGLNLSPCGLHQISL